MPLLPGDCVVIPAGIKHWHEAEADSWFSHLALEVPGCSTSNLWLEPGTIWPMNLWKAGQHSEEKPSAWSVKVYESV